MNTLNQKILKEKLINKDLEGWVVQRTYHIKRSKKQYLKIATNLVVTCWKESSIINEIVLTI